MVLLSTARGRRQRYVPLRRIEVSRGAQDCFVLPGIFPGRIGSVRGAGVLPT